MRGNTHSENRAELRINPVVLITNWEKSPLDALGIVPQRGLARNVHLKFSSHMKIIDLIRQMNLISDLYLNKNEIAA